ncbi:MAG: helicase-related protein [Bryobacteraceae bacterium]
MSDRLLFFKSDSSIPFSLLRRQEEWGLETLDLVAPPRRFWGDQEALEGLVELGLDARRLRQVRHPSELLASPLGDDNWQAMSRRSVGRLHAYFLALEDPERRLDIRSVETLAHQVSLVRHILENGALKRVLIADEVGLGKTVEAGLILKELLTQRPSLRVLYLTPARLVTNVRREFDRLKLPFRQWTALDSDARLSDPRIVASIHKAVLGSNFERLTQAQGWDVLVIDECHHISAWSPEGTDVRLAYRLVKKLIENQPPDSRIILMSGTPHQGHATRFENLLRLLQAKQESQANLAGRVIYRTKDDIQDWEGNPVFPPRQVNEPLIVDLGPDHRKWLKNIYEFYCPPKLVSGQDENWHRAAGWRCAQAMQWATSSPLAGLGYLVRQAIRARWGTDNVVLRSALAALRPYRLGPEDEAIDVLHARIAREVDRQERSGDLEDIENSLPGHTFGSESRRGLERLLEEGVALLRAAGDEKLERIYELLLKPFGGEKAVLFAQPIETVTAVARFLERRMGRRPALILGGQTDEDRSREVEAFRRHDGPKYLVSSRAGGEGINLQVARRLVHLDVPWNPMDMEQRVGRVHRFGSRDTVIVDTVVVKDSREWDAYRVAREKLKLIASALVEPERIESVFSRVMCLMSQDDLTTVMISGFGSPLNNSDQARLAELVQQGFQQWKDFHEKYGKQQTTIRLQNPGLANWEDLAFFMEEIGGSRRVPGYKRQRFARTGAQVHSQQDEAIVLRLAGGAPHVCADYGESLVYAPDGAVVPKLGTNLPEVAEALRKAAFPSQPTGAAILRWPSGVALPRGAEELPFALLAFAKQTIQPDGLAGWAERKATLHVFVARLGGVQELSGVDKADLIRQTLRTVVRKTQPPELTPLSEHLREVEAKLAYQLRKPTEDEVASQIRHSVTPLFAGIFTD